MRKTWLIFSQAVTVAVAMLFVVATLKPDWIRQGGASGVLPSIVATPVSISVAASAAGSGYASAAKLASPAVVSVMTSRAAARTPQGEDPLLRFFFGDPQAEPQGGVGSGVIVSSEGYVLTNNHVVEGFDEIEVMLSDGRRTRGRTIGSDPETDLAVLKIELDKLPTITFGNSEALQVGDVVLAIGNPFGVGQTVTSGIVSALGRNQLGINTFENFIQTDAAINPGNSGGALVDAAGNLMGINTAIYSRSGGSLGIGFAIPASTARQVLEGLILNGVVRRGWIGVEPRELTPEIAETFNLPVSEGVLITGVLQGGPASKAGLRPGDVVVGVADEPVRNTAQLLNAVANLAPPARAALKVQRGKDVLDLEVEVAQRPPQQALRRQR